MRKFIVALKNDSGKFQHNQLINTDRLGELQYLMHANCMSLLIIALGKVRDAQASQDYKIV